MKFSQQRSGRDPDVLVDPLDQLLLACRSRGRGTSRATIGSRTRIDAHERILAAEDRLQLLLPASSGRPRPDAAPDVEDRHRALVRAEAVLHVVWLPRALLLVLGERDAVVGEGGSLRAHVGEARRRPALQVLREQAVGAPDRRVGVVVRPERADARCSSRSRHGSGRSRRPCWPSTTCCSAAPSCRSPRARGSRGGRTGPRPP